MCVCVRACVCVCVCVWRGVGLERGEEGLSQASHYVKPTLVISKIRLNGDAGMESFCKDTNHLCVFSRPYGRVKEGIR